MRQLKQKTAKIRVVFYGEEQLTEECHYVMEPELTCIPTAREQRKLGNIFQEYTEKNHLELPALTIVQGGGTVRREEIYWL